MTNREMLVLAIQCLVADDYRMPVSLLRGKRKYGQVAIARQLAVALSVETLHGSYNEFARDFRCARSSIGASIKKVKDLTASDATFRTRVERLRTTLANGKSYHYA